MSIVTLSSSQHGRGRMTAFLIRPFPISAPTARHPKRTTPYTRYFFVQSRATAAMIQIAPIFPSAVMMGMTTSKNVQVT